MQKIGETANTVISCPTTSHGHILVVDDDFENRQISFSILVHSGFEVDTADDGVAAWQALNTGRYDLLVTNDQMPGMSGVELLMKLYSVHMGVPVIIIAQSLPGNVFTRYPWLKSTATLLQPCTVAELLETVNEVLCAATLAGEQIVPSPNLQSRPSSQWFADMMILLRSPLSH
jgi:two-component system response regulator (stage 0 sporulation protein F)